MAWTNGPSRTSSSAHKAWAAAVMRRDRGLCHIRGPRCTHVAAEADHILPVARGGDPLDIANGQAVCHTCHQVKTNAEAAEGRRIAAANRPTVRRPAEAHPGLA